MAKAVTTKQSLAKYLADYIDHEIEETGKFIVLDNLETVIAEGLEAFKSINEAGEPTELSKRFDKLVELAQDMLEALYEFKSDNADYYNEKIVEIRLAK